MLVEDEASIRRLLGTTLRRNGYQVLEAATGQEAIDRFAEHRDTVHLLITDVRMPQMTGPELIRTLRASKPDLKVLCISGCIASIPDDLAAEISVLQKPFSRQELIAEVGRIVNDRPGRSNETVPSAHAPDETAHPAGTPLTADR
jgi:two-component system cell cycle sensor histidine kinase/response regulator CckA